MKQAVIIFTILTLVSCAPQTRVVGGQAASPGQFPHQILLKYMGSFTCGGSILNDRWILTASHCVQGRSARYLTVVTGSTAASGAGGSIYQAALAIQHPQYGNFMNDIALIKLSSPIKFNNVTSAISVGTKNPAVNANVTLSGFGRTSHGGAVAQQLQFVDSTVVSQSQCETSTGIRHPGTICVFSRAGKGVCNGDSGGPAIVTENGKQVLFGVANFIITACAYGNPDGYSNAVYYRDWINQTIAAN